MSLFKFGANSSEIYCPLRIYLAGKSEIWEAFSLERDKFPKEVCEAFESKTLLVS